MHSLPQKSFIFWEDGLFVCIHTATCRKRKRGSQKREERKKENRGARTKWAKENYLPFVVRIVLSVVSCFEFRLIPVFASSENGISPSFGLRLHICCGYSISRYLFIFHGVTASLIFLNLFCLPCLFVWHASLCCLLKR